MTNNEMKELYTTGDWVVVGKYKNLDLIDYWDYVEDVNDLTYRDHIEYKLIHKNHYYEFKHVMNGGKVKVKTTIVADWIIIDNINDFILDYNKSFAYEIIKDKSDLNGKYCFATKEHYDKLVKYKCKPSSKWLNKNKPRFFYIVSDTIFGTDNFSIGHEYKPMHSHNDYWVFGSLEHEGEAARMIRLFNEDVEQQKLYDADNAYEIIKDKSDLNGKYCFATKEHYDKLVKYKCKPSSKWLNKNKPRFFYIVSDTIFGTDNFSIGHEYKPMHSHNDYWVFGSLEHDNRPYREDCRVCKGKGINHGVQLKPDMWGSEPCTACKNEPKPILERITREEASKKDWVVEYSQNDWEYIGTLRITANDVSKVEKINIHGIEENNTINVDGIIIEFVNEKLGEIIATEANGEFTKRHGQKEK